MLRKEIIENIPSKLAGIELEGKPNSIGVALVIVGIDPRRNGENSTDPTIWTVREKKTKESTQKVAGQISFPGETRKVGEKPTPNIIGALSEFTDNNFQINHNLFLTPSSFRPGIVSIRGNPVDIAVLMYVGPQTDSFTPVDQDDVAPHKWMAMSEIKGVIKKEPNMIRKFAQDIIRMEFSDPLIGKAIGEFLHDPMSRLPVSALLPQGFSTITSFHHNRERMSDVAIFDNNVN